MFKIGYGLEHLPVVQFSTVTPTSSLVSRIVSVGKSILEGHIQQLKNFLLVKCEWSGLYFSQCHHWKVLP